MSDPPRPLTYGTALIGEAERRAVEAVLRDRVLYRYHGSVVAGFEQRFADWLGEGALALAVNSGTSALQLALATCDLAPGDEVLVPTFGFVSAATAVHAAGGVPRFVGVDHSLAIDVQRAADAVSERTRAILAVHPYGAPCDLAALGELSRCHNLRVVEDVAQACGGSFRGRRLGTHGDAAAFSFQHFKLLATGEGGMVVTRDRNAHDQVSFLHDSAAIWTMPERAERVRSARLAPGNLRMSELEAAIGLVQLERCDGLISALRETKRRAREALVAAGASLAPCADPAGEAGTHLVAYLADAAEAEAAAVALRRRGVATSPLLGEPGSNRHWAGDWEPVLERCGIEAADGETVERERRMLAAGISIQLDVTLAGEAGDRWLEGLAAALGERAGV